MTEYQRQLAMFDTEAIPMKVVLSERDLKLMCSLFENKIASRDQINKQFFHGVSVNTVNRRLRKLVGLGLITRVAAMVSGRVICGYCLSRKGLTKIKPMLPYKVKTKTTLSDCPLHDIALNDIRQAFEAKDTVQSYYTENVLQTCTGFKSDRQFRPFVELNSDAMAEVNSKVGVLNLAIEFDTTVKSKDRYRQKVDAYYVKRGVDGVLYVSASKHILNTLLKIDKEVADRHRRKPKVYLAMLGDVIGEQDEMTFTNAIGYIFRVR